MTPMSKTVEVLSAPEFGWFLDRLAARIEQGRSLERGTVSIADATPEQRRSVDDLLGRRSTGGRSLTICLSRLNLPELETAVIELRGPLVNLRAGREAEAEGWVSRFADWRRRANSHAPLLRWLEKLEAGGLLKRYGDAPETLMEQAWRVVEGIPHDDVLLATLGAQVSGDSHALDRGRPLAALCYAAIFELEGIDGRAGAEARREAWAAIGVVLDDLSAPVLCLNVRAAEGSEAAPWIDWQVARGEPFYLTWRQLRKFVPDSAMDAVFVCENPALVSEAARRLGARCRPLVCLNGAPTAAVRFLLRRVAQAGIGLRLRADFDWAGLRFLHQLLGLDGAELWRMSAADYRACQPSQPLKGEAFAPTWAEGLAAAMIASGLAAYEEELVEVLMADLDSKANG